MKAVFLIFVFALPHIVYSDWFLLDEIGKTEQIEAGGMQYSNSCEILNDLNIVRNYCIGNDSRSATSFVASIKCKGNYLLMSGVSGYMNCEKLKKYNPELTAKFKVPPSTLLETEAGDPGFVVGLPRSHFDCKYVKKNILSTPTRIPSCAALPRICVADIQCRTPGRNWIAFMGKEFEQKITCRAEQVNAKQWKCPKISICLRDHNIRVQPSYDEDPSSSSEGSSSSKESKGIR